MKALIKVGGIHETPMGWAIRGSNPVNIDMKEEFISQEFEDPRRNSSPLEYIAYKDSTGSLKKLKIEKFEVTSNMSNTYTFNILLGNIDVPEEIKEGTPIYRG